MVEMSSNSKYEISRETRSIGLPIYFTTFCQSYSSFFQFYFVLGIRDRATVKVNLVIQVLVNGRLITTLVH